MKWLARVGLHLVVVSLVGCSSTKVTMLEEQESSHVANRAHGASPPVLVLPVRDAQGGGAVTNPNRAVDPTYVGDGVVEIGSFLVIPWVATVEFHTAKPRSELVRRITIAELEKQGVPADMLAEEDFDALPEDRLGVEVRIVKLKMETRFSRTAPLLLVNLVEFTDTVAEAVLHCEIRQPRKASALWAGEISASSGEVDVVYTAAGGVSVAPALAIRRAVDQCIQESKLVERHGKAAPPRP